ncbi:hypothetical protein EDE12_10418 [Methylosinus sp. sav-2]|uniref:hypothetical protein n=1 Tax=Methylosinus sp. sav-2 TaxID=2485168 RepID=UPI001064F8E4|nr:hypothetical protein [Methylosinus sp. sav-2]TDX64728.1 hypothetical protein EDE12_10418 [Methylosinus sp. sav-2]
MLFVTPLHADPVDFDAFFNEAASCRQSQAFTTLHKNIGDRYGNDADSKNTKVNQSVSVKIPPEIRAGIGKARSVNKGEYTQVVVPLDGFWRGLKLQELEFAVGNENGVQQWRIRFSEPRSAVLRVFGTEVSAANRALKTDPDRAPFGHSAKIPKGSSGEIVCDFST